MQRHEMAMEKAKAVARQFRRRMIAMNNVLESQWSIHL